jgi:hypothetical protein
LPRCSAAASLFSAALPLILRLPVRLRQSSFTLTSGLSGGGIRLRRTAIGVHAAVTVVVMTLPAPFVQTVRHELSEGSDSTHLTPGRSRSMRPSRGFNWRGKPVDRIGKVPGAQRDHHLRCRRSSGRSHSGFAAVFGRRPHVRRQSGVQDRSNRTSSFPGATRVQIQRGSDLIADDLARERMGGWYFTALAGVAIALGLGSVFGVVTYSIAAERRIYAIMLALGASSRAWLFKAIGVGAVPVAIGVLAEGTAS